MQQGHPRHKQLSRARHEMAIHRQYMFAKKINEGMASFVNGVRKVMYDVSDGIVSALKAEHKGLPGVRGPKPGQTMDESMTEQIFELQKENEALKERLIR